MGLMCHSQGERSATIVPTLWLCLGISILFLLTAYATDPPSWNDPAWWTARGAVVAPLVETNNGVVTTNYITNNNAVVTQGQLKQFTARAVDELNADLTNVGGAGSALNNLVSGWKQDYATNNYNNATNPFAPYKPSDFTTINVGQLKYIAHLVDTQLIAADYLAQSPSWLQGTNATDSNVAVIGQLKTVFDFDLTKPTVPTSVSVTENGSQATVTWSESSSATGFIIQTSSDGGASWINATTISGTATTGTVTNLQAGTSYLFRVEASNASGASPPSLSVSPPPDYYNGQTPTLSKVSGDSQLISANTFSANPLIVHVTNSSGTALTNAPLTFSLAAGSDGGLALSSGIATATSVNVTTDSSGNATVYYQSGADVLVNNTITATAISSAGSVSVNFVAHCGIQNGLAAWLDADVGAEADANGNVTVWQDQSANTNSASQSNNSIEPKLVASSLQGHSVVRFDGSTTYLATPPSVSDDFTMVVVFRSSAGSGTGTQWYSDGGIIDAYVGAGANDFGLSLDQNGDVLTGVGNPDTTITSSLGGYNDGRGHIATFFRTEANGAFAQYVDSVLQGTQTGNTRPLTDSPQITIGATQDLSHYFGGDVAEVLFFNRNLSSTEQGQIEGFLADKYGLYDTNSSWPQSYPTDVQAQITANHWDKTQADAYVSFVASNPPVPAPGLLLWLKANAGLTTDSSGNVTQWIDQSPSGHVLSQNSQAGPPVLMNDANGNPALSFNGSQAVYAPDYVPANGDMTMIVVGSSANTWSYSTAATLGGNPQPGTQRAYVYSYGSDVFDLYNEPIQGGTSSPVGEQEIHTVTFNRNSGAVNFYLAGNYNGYGNGTANDITSGLEIGESAGFYSGYFGTISQVLVYNRVLSTSERNQAEGGLADQYGIYSANATWPMAYNSDVQALITENGWSKAQADAYVSSASGTVWAPTVSPPAGTYSASQTVTVNSATSDATIYYTTDGTTPTTSSSSLSNGGQLTISSSTQLKLLAADEVATNSSVTTAIYQIGNSGQLAAGDSFTMALKSNGSVWTWGDDSRGQQGDNHANGSAAMPQQVPGLATMSAVAAAGDHAFALDANGNVWAWGADDQSQCGDGGTSDLAVPTQISGMPSIGSIFAGEANGFAIDNGGHLYAWGDNSNGQLGDGTNNSQSTPEEITSVTGVTKVASSPLFTLVLKSDGTVWSTGYNGDGELGDGTQSDENFFQQVPNLSGVIDIAVGHGHALALLSDGTVYSWGYGGDGELGNGVYGSVPYPKQVPGLPAAVAVRAADSKSFVVLADGTVRAFGGSNEGEMGVGSTQNQSSPVQPTGISNVALLSAGSFHVVVSNLNGALSGWGQNSSFQLTQDFSSSTWTSGTNAVYDNLWNNMTAVASGEFVSAALKNDGTVWAVGSGISGALGQGNLNSSRRPVQVANLVNITKIAGGGNGSFYAIDENGTLWSWGGNYDGQLGIGNYTYSPNATAVTSISNVTGVSAGSQHVLILQSNGTVLSAGDDSYGELGDGATNAQPTPIPVPNVASAIQVASGNNTSFVLKSDGTVWAWGENDTGQLGLGSTTNVSFPTKITGSSTNPLPALVAISAYGTNGMGLDANGNVWNWGALGNPDGTPCEQPGLTGVKTIAAGYYHDLAIKSDKTVWGLGANFENQLGNAGGSNYSIGTFTQLPDIQGATALAGCYGSSLIAKEDGSIAALGNCAQGQLAGNLGPYNYLPKSLFGIAMTETPPSISITTPAAGTTNPMGTAIQFQASTSASSASIVEVDYYLNGVKLGSSTSAGTWNFSWTPTTYGNLAIEAVAIDSSGAETLSAPAIVNVPYDSDGNGLPDWWELQYFGQVGNNPNSQSPSGDGNTLLQDYQAGVTPIAPASATLAIVSGNNQVGASGAFLANPLVVSVKSLTGTPLVNTAVTFYVAGGNGIVSSSAQSTNSGSSAVVSTNSEGLASVYLQQPLQANATNNVVAQLPSNGNQNSVTFSASTLPDNGPPAAATNLYGVWLGGGQVNLTWKNNADNATSVEIQQGGNNVATVPSTQTSYVLNEGTQGWNSNIQLITVGANGQATTSFSGFTGSGTYAMINLGAGITTVKLTNSGYILYHDRLGNYYRWCAGAATLLQPPSGGNILSVNDINESGTVVGTGLSNSLASVLLTWQAQSTTPATTETADATPPATGNTISSAFIDGQGSVWSYQNGTQDGGYYSNSIIGGTTFTWEGYYWSQTVREDTERPPIHEGYTTGDTVIPLGTNELGTAFCSKKVYNTTSTTFTDNVYNVSADQPYTSTFIVNTTSTDSYILSSGGSDTGVTIPFEPYNLNDASCAVGQQADGTFAFWNNIVYTLPTGFSPSSLNTATSSTGAPAYQIIGSSTGGLALLQMNSQNGLFDGPPELLQPLISGISSSTAFTPAGDTSVSNQTGQTINDNGLIAADEYPNGVSLASLEAAGYNGVLLVPFKLVNLADPYQGSTVIGTPSHNDQDTTISLSSTAGSTDINNVAWIAAGDASTSNNPRMPKLQATVAAPGGTMVWWKLSVIFHGQNNPANNYRDFDPSATLTGTQISQLTNTSETGTIGYSDNIDVPMPSGSADTGVVGGWVPIAAGTPWNIYSDPDWVAAVGRGFFGGDAILSFKITSSDGTTTILPEQDFYFRIAGENPVAATCESYINTTYGGPTENWTGLTFTPGTTPPTVPGYWFAYAIAKEETDGDGGRTYYNNFMDNGGQLSSKGTAWPGHEGRPDWNNDDIGGDPQYGTGGYGLFQLTYEGAHGTQPAEANFIMPRDWIWNWQSNVQQFASKMQEKLQQEQSSLNGNHTSFGASFTDPSTLTVVKDGVTFNFWEAAVITRNNGGKGWYPKATNTPTIWGAYKPAGSTGYLYNVAHKGINNHP